MTKPIVSEETEVNINITEKICAVIVTSQSLRLFLNNTLLMFEISWSVKFVIAYVKGTWFQYVENKKNISKQQIH